MGTNKATTESETTYAEARTRLPPFAWNPANTNKASRTIAPDYVKRWPFFGQTIFKRMGSTPVPVPAGAKPTVSPNTSNEAKLESNLAVLRDLGFNDNAVSTSKLVECGYNLNRAADALLNSIPTPSESNGCRDASPAEDSAGKRNTAECPICFTEATQWNVLDCSHKICLACRARLLTCGRSMAGRIHTFVKCPFCNGVSGGTELGTCPDGQMKNVVFKQHLPGYEEYETLAITYTVKTKKYNLCRTGYFPNSPEGQRVAALLRIAWDRRLVFSIGTSLTTGREDTLVWNIHHKTAMTGGVACHGYPDKTYLERLLEELKQYGIE